MAIQEYEAYVERLWRDVSSLEYLEERPRVRVTPAAIDFGRVLWVTFRANAMHAGVLILTTIQFCSYKRRATRHLLIENVGKVGGVVLVLPSGFTGHAEGTVLLPFCPTSTHCGPM